MSAIGKSIVIDRRKLTLAAAVLASGALGGCNKKPPPPPTPAEEATAFVDDLRQSGPVSALVQSILQDKATDVWTATFDLGRENLRRGDHDPGGLWVGPVSCFRKGCMVELRYKNRAAADAFEKNILIGLKSPLRHWPGRIYRSPFVAGAGATLSATWALLFDESRHKDLEALPTGKQALATPEDPVPTQAVSNLQQGE
jgi:hypothetical protein